jgi:chemotaxis protein methyltransferase WspC
MKPGSFKQWLKERMGLDADTIGPTVVDRAVRERMAASASGSLSEYW